MSVLTAVVRLEGKRVLRDRAMIALLVVFTLFAGYALLSGARWAEDRSEAVAAVVQEADDTMALRRRNFVETIARGERPNFGLIYATALPFRAGLPNAPLAPLSAGQAEGYPAAAAISPFVDPYGIFERYTTGLENPAVLAAGRFDLAFVIVMLLPLLLIAATYDFWTRDVESGSARIQLAQPVSPARLVLGRAAIRGGAMLIPATLIATILLALFGGGGDPAGLALFALVVLGYGSFWILLTAAINLFVRTSTAAALSGGTAWLVIVVLLPATLAAIANLTAPRPSLRDHTNAVRAATLEVRAANAPAARAAATAQSNRAYPATLWHSRREIGVRDARLAPIHLAYAEAAERHRDVAGTLRVLSPAALTQDALDRLAGTDATRAIAFQGQARAFAGTTRQLALEWMDTDRLMTLADYDDGRLPRFQFEEPDRSGALGLDLLALLLLGGAVLTLALLRLRRGAAAIL